VYVRYAHYICKDSLSLAQLDIRLLTHSVIKTTTKNGVHKMGF